MVDHSRLETALAELATLLLGDFVVDDVLARLCEHAVRVLPVFGAGVSLLAGDELHVAWATGPEVRRLEGLQRRFRQGPCEDVLTGGEPLCVVMQDQLVRWPDYTPAATRLGVGGVAALPLRARGRIWGVMDVYTTEDLPLGEEEMHAARVLTDVATAYLVTAWDRRAREVAEDQLRLQALHDPLTGLPNRLLLHDRLRHALAVVSRQPGSVGLLFLDLDRFKQVNDSHGHAAGDRLLIAVAGRLIQALRPSDTLCRLGGDEFVVLCEDLHVGGDDLHAIGQRLLDALAVPLHLAEGEIEVHGSIGGVLAGDDDLPEQLLRSADMAMYAAKRSGVGVLIADGDAELGYLGHTSHNYS